MYRSVDENICIFVKTVSKKRRSNILNSLSSTRSRLSIQHYIHQNSYSFKIIPVLTTVIQSWVFH